MKEITYWDSQSQKKIHHQVPDQFGKKNSILELFVITNTVLKYTLGEKKRPYLKVTESRVSSMKHIW